MKKILINVSVLISLMITMGVPVVVSAQDANFPAGAGDGQFREPGDTQDRLPSPVVTSDCSSTLCNPLKGVDSIGGLVFKVIDFVYSLSYAVIAIFLIISGFKFVAARGSETALTDAKNTFKYTIIGAVLLIGANVITVVIENLIKSFRV